MSEGEVMAMLAVAGKVYGKDVRPDLIQVWHEFMLDVSADEGARAMRQHVAESQYFPTVADIRKRVTAGRVDAPDIGRAWGEVLSQVRAVGSYKSPRFSHPAIENAVNALGWVEICMTLDSDVPTLRAQFERYYKAGLETSAKDQNHGRLESARRAGSITAGDAIRGLLKGGD